MSLWMDCKTYLVSFPTQLSISPTQFPEPQQVIMALRLRSDETLIDYPDKQHTQ